MGYTLPRRSNLLVASSVTDRVRSAVDQLSTLMPQIAALLVDAGAVAAKGRR